MLLDKLREEVLKLGFLGLVLKAGVAYGLSAAEVIDADDQGLEIAKESVDFDSNIGFAKTDQAQADDRNLKIGVHHGERAIKLHVLALGHVEIGCDRRQKW